MTTEPFDGLIGGELDTVSFVRDYVELRIDYSIFRALTDPEGSIDGVAWKLRDPGAADLLRRYIGRTVLLVDVVEGEHITILFNGGATISVSLRTSDRVGAESAELVPAGPDGRLDLAATWIW